MRTKNELYQEALRTIAARRQTARALAEDARAEAEAVIPALRHAEEEVRVRGIRCALAGAAGKDRTEAAAALADAWPENQALPALVFVTAYDQYAIDAFDKGAVDYLLKPIAPERLAATVQRVQSRLSRGNPDAEAFAAMLSQLGARLPAAVAEPLVWITASTGKETRLIMVDDIAYFQADNKYTVVMTAEGEALLRKPIRELLDVLDPVLFKQIHRSTIVNLKAIASITRDDTGKGTVKLKSRPETLTVSQPFMALFRNM